MFLGDIWWNQIPASLKFFEQLKTALAMNKNVVYVSKAELPWWRTLYSKVKTHMGDITSTRTLEHIHHERGCVPGKMVMERFCSVEIQAQYWPDKSYAEYLSSIDETTLNSRIIWVESINDADSAGAWLDFVKEYNRHRKAKCECCQRAIFILGCTGTFNLDVNNDIFFTCDTMCDAFDRYMFCAMNTADLKCGYYLKQYVAELAFNLGGDNLELCGELAIRGEDLMASPRKIYEGVFSEVCFDTSEPKKPELINSCIRVSQSKILFPVLEQRRLELIKKYRRDLVSLLPVQNSFDDLVYVPENLEVGTLYHLCNNQRFRMEKDDYHALTKYRDARNRIAHNEIIPIDTIKFVLG